MLYKPNFCCNCGEKIERADWNLLTSRRFCPVCAEENKKHDYLPRAAVVTGALGLVFGLGILFGGKAEQPARVQTLSSSPVRISEAPASREPQPRPVQSNVPPVITAPGDSTTPAPGTLAKAAPPRTFYCGAFTKKGTPCSRKVKNENTRCYQHEGKPAATSVE